jgi:adenylate kinase
LNDLGQPLDAVLLLDVRRETLMQRLAGRRICPKCGAVYNVHTLPAGTTTCANDGTELYQRPDDKEEVIGKRLEVYEQQTRPLVEHYSQLGLLRAIAGEGDLDDVFERMEAAALAKPVPAEKVKLERTRDTAAKKKTTPKAVAKSSEQQLVVSAPKPAAKPAVEKPAAKTAAPEATSKQSASTKAASKRPGSTKSASKKSVAKPAAKKAAAKVSRKGKAGAKTAKRAAASKAAKKRGKTSSKAKAGAKKSAKRKPAPRAKK